ncbi:MAG: N-acetylmuramoyl-L-alanine amidase [Bdellovibrionaceae bacterium]|nr:N-acetylmuramoyl-L-alanine amidase [Pseudobdellovibrionaceae bacterium]
MKLEALRQANDIEDHRIRVGQVLKIPAAGGATAAPPQPEKKLLFVARVQRQVEVKKLDRHKWKHVILHHSGTPTGSGKIFDYYHRKVRHMENGLAYHFVIGNGSDSGDGEIEVAERWARQIKGGHVKSEEYNENSIGICLVGNFERMRPSKEADRGGGGIGGPPQERDAGGKAGAVDAPGDAADPVSGKELSGRGDAQVVRVNGEGKGGLVTS